MVILKLLLIVAIGLLAVALLATFLEESWIEHQRHQRKMRSLDRMIHHEDQDVRTNR